MVLDKTRLDTLLDLFFVNDESSILDIKVLHNNGLFDHNLCLVSTNIMAPPDLSAKNELPYSTNITKYNLLEASDEDWVKLNNYFKDIDWMRIVGDKLLENITDIIIKTVETAVTVICGSLS